jgi:uncharacterized DUF497 family protein
MENVMKAVRRACVLTALIAAAFCTNAYQPVDAGLNATHQKIENLQERIYALAGEFSAHVMTRAKRKEIGHRMVALISERKALEAEVRQARALSDSSLITYVSPLDTQ